MAIPQLDTENADLDLTALVTILTHTPSATEHMRCQAHAEFGDGVKDLDGAGGSFEFTLTVGGQTIQPNPARIQFGTEVRSYAETDAFTVPANEEVVWSVKSPNAADTDVDVTAYLFDVQQGTDSGLTLGQFLGLK